MHRTPHKAPLYHWGSSAEAQVSSCLLAVPGECLWECASQPHSFLPAALPCPCLHGEAVSSMYQGLDLVGIVCTKEWSTEPFPIEVGVYHRGPLSVIIFNTVMNTLVDTTGQAQHLGYSLSSTSQQCNLLQYADNTSLPANRLAACQALLDCIVRRLEWSDMKAKVSKCCSLALQASSSRELTLNRPCVGKPSLTSAMAHSSSWEPQ